MNIQSIHLELRTILTSLIKPATKLIVQNAIRPPERGHLNSYFGGIPYLSANAIWPITQKGNALEFVFQIYNDGSLPIPTSIKLLQFFYDYEEFPWDTADDGWALKLYSDVDQLLPSVEQSQTTKISKYCLISTEPINSLPDWDGIDSYSRRVTELCCLLNSEEPWGVYKTIVDELIGEQAFQSQLGGYPKWVQGDSTPLKKDGTPTPLLFQIDSEENARLMWGDTGLIYAFYDEESNDISFTLQCL